MTRWIAPLALALVAFTLMIVLMVLGFAGGLIIDALGKPRWLEVAAAAIWVGALGIIFAALRGTSRELYEKEGENRPGWLDHVRHAALLYAVLIGLFGWAIVTRAMDMFGIALFLPLAALLGIVADYSMLRRRRRDRAC